MRKRYRCAMVCLKFQHCEIEADFEPKSCLLDNTSAVWEEVESSETAQKVTGAINSVDKLVRNLVQNGQETLNALKDLKDLGGPQGPKQGEDET